VYELASDKGVFAYSRISPDGRFLAYASEARNIVSGSGRSQVVTVVDLLEETVVFEEPGIDAYWSPDGQRMIYLSYRDAVNTVVVRSLADCADVLDTGLPGAKADFSWDGRYIAFHAPNTSGRGYEIQVVDLESRTVRTITRLSGSSFFPSWTRDGRLSFRYDGNE
jgi:Tol biopolymer transport system component